MQYDFEKEWRLARGHEANGELAAAKAIYVALLQQDPHRLYARMRLSALEQSLGHYRSSREHALKLADTVRAGRWKDLAAVSRRLLSFDEHDVVHGLIADADWRDPEILKSAATLAQHLWLTDHVAEALQLIEASSPHMPSSYLLSYSKANVLRYSGRMEEATAEYERCLSLEPNFPHGHWSLAYHKRSVLPGSRIDRIKKAQAALAEDAPEQAYLYYALFKEFDDAGEIDLAWKNLQAGARSKRRAIRYDAIGEQQGIAALRRLTSRDFIGSDTRQGASGVVPIFIVGLPRTGTTLLERILGNHSQIKAAGELNDFNCALSWESDMFWDNAINAAFVEGMRDIDYRRVGEDYLRRIQGKAKGARYLIDKNPMNFVNAGFIGKALPDARILCLSRGAMDSCLSNLKELFSSAAYGYSYDLSELADHYVSFSQLLEHWRQVMPERFHVVDYERLVADPFGTAEQVMAFCGVPFEPDCIDITKNAAPVSTASSSQVRQPIHTQNVGAWRRYATYLEPLRVRIERALPSAASS